MPSASSTKRAAPGARRAHATVLGGRWERAARLCMYAAARSCKPSGNMLQCPLMKTNRILIVFLAIMAGLIAAAVFFQAQFIALLNQPSLRGHALFVHIAAATLFFANAVVGMLWEWRSLESGSKDMILHTYGTVAWLDARFSSPLIVLSVIAGLMLSFMMGDLWEIGWLSVGFVLFLLSGIVWVASDIPTQRRVKKLMAGLDPADGALPPELVRLLKLRWRIGLAGVAPLVIVFALMVYKPDIPAVALLFR